MIRHVSALELEMPAGKLPGFYAQIIHKIGDKVHVYDRSGQIFVLADPAEVDKLQQILGKYNMTAEAFELYQLPDETEIPLLDDYGFQGIEGHSYLFAHLVSLIQLKPTDQDKKNSDPADMWAAIEQLREYFIAELPQDSSSLYVLDTTHLELAEQIAIRYQVQVILTEQTSQ